MSTHPAEKSSINQHECHVGPDWFSAGLTGQEKLCWCSWSTALPLPVLALSTLFLTSLLRFKLWVALPVWGTCIEKD